MDRFAKIICWSFALSVLAILLHNPASAITAELAKKCRAMAIKAHPPARAGTKTHTAQAERDLYRVCLANNGTAADTDTDKAPAPTSK